MTKFNVGDKVRLTCDCHDGVHATVCGVENPGYFSVMLSGDEELITMESKAELIKEDNMDEKTRFEATMKKIDGAKVCDEYKDFARDVVRGIFGEEKKEEWEDITSDVVVKLVVSVSGSFVQVYHLGGKRFYFSQENAYGHVIGCNVHTSEKGKYKFEFTGDAYRFYVLTK